MAGGDRSIKLLTSPTLHGVTKNEAEEVFLDEKIQIKRDIKHQEVEERFIAIGKSIEGKILFAAFTVRDTKIRIVSVRVANEKERRRYAEKP